MEKEQIARLYEAYARDVYRLALSWLRSTHDAEDILQSVFLKLLDKQCHHLPRPGEGLASDLHRQRLQGPPADLLASEYPAPGHRIVAPADEDRSLWEAVVKLKPTYRAVVHLYYYEGCRQDEIAAILGISHATVQTRTKRAREILKRELNCNG